MEDELEARKTQALVVVALGLATLCACFVTILPVMI
jgi:hypothetical protein